ncbi:MAG TPA: pentapeptide repeat-containing protein, partial [Thermoanaerobaculia bacterium]|nr:pentapeptide repeat-containing protein [Thermoanaerobaculia bacterium]
MPEEDLGIQVKQPVSVWNRPLRADGKGIFKALGKGVAHLASGQWAALGADAVDGLTAVGLGQDAGELAWLLIRRALLAAMVELVKEQLPVVARPTDASVMTEQAERLDAAIGAAEVSVDRAFFERPARLPLLGALRAPFADWLAGYGLDAAAARAVAERLPSYFVVELDREWRRRPAEYEPIRAGIATPFTAAAERERAWVAYAARLEKQLDEPLFGEAFGLRQLYVPLRAFYLNRREEGGLAELGKAAAGEQEPPKRVAVELERAIDEWAANGNRTDCLRVLSGGPGSGKSSFAKVYAAAAAGRRRRVLYVPLHLFNFGPALDAAVGEYVRADVLPANPLDRETGEPELLLIFDGLDELAQRGRLGAETARDFVREVQKAIELRNAEARRLLVLVTGREPVVQASASELREPRQILHLLPYLVPKAERQQDVWESGRELLATDQRADWWQRYGRVSGKGYEGLPGELAREDLEEITAQPLLNYLVALGYGRGKLDFQGEVNLNDIYADLLDAVYERAWERGRRVVPDLSLAEFSRVLEEIALAAWHGNGRTTTVEEIEAHCQAAGLAALLGRFAEGAKSGVLRVLTAFYFRQHGHTAAGDRTFEFTHKSFREYLTARRIVRAVRTIHEETERRRQGSDGGWDEGSALKHWAEICGPEAMDLDLFEFVAAEARRRPDEARAWQGMLCRLIGHMLRNGMPMELLGKRPSFRMETLQARNAEEALLAALNACARTTEVISTIDWPGDTGDEHVSAGAWIRRLQGQRSGATNALALSCLSYLDLSGCVLDMIDLYGADLRKADLSGAALYSACLGQADLRGTNLEGATLHYAYLVVANLRGAHLVRARLGGAN